MRGALVKAISDISALPLEIVKGKVGEVRAEVKKMRKEETFPPRKALKGSQQMLSAALELDEEIIKRAGAKASLSVKDEIVLEGSKEVLKVLRERGYTIITLGNIIFWPSAYTRLILERFNLAQYIAKQFYSDELNTYKPLREMFLKPLSYFDIHAKEAVHVGDTKAEDFDGAIKAGLYAIYINPQGKTEKLSEGGMSVKSIKEILDIIPLISPSR